MLSKNYKFILTEVKDNIGIITLNNPKKLNSLSPALLEELIKVFQTFERDNNIRVIIITGTGKAFVAGADVNQFLGKNNFQGREIVREIQVFFLSIERSSKTIIAAINGYCLGGGLELAMSCDIRYASENAMLGQPEISLGIIPGAGGTQRLPRLIGKGKAKEMILGGKNISAKEALGVQLVQKVTSADTLMEETLTLGKLIANKSPLIVSLAKEAIDQGFESPIEVGLTIEADKFSQCFTTKDKEEGVKAFFEKRDPIFSGK